MVLDSIPKLYHYFPQSITNNTKPLLVIELLGKNFKKLSREYKSFSVATCFRISLQLVSIHL